MHDNISGRIPWAFLIHNQISKNQQTQGVNDARLTSDMEYGTQQHSSDSFTITATWLANKYSAGPLHQDHFLNNNSNNNNKTTRTTSKDVPK